MYDQKSIEKVHRVAWQYGKGKFSYSGDMPVPRGVLIGEAPGPNTDPRLPLFPDPGNSAGARLLRYAGVEPIDWIGKLVCMNLCDETWSDRRANAGRARALAFLLDERNYHDGSPLRVLLLGARVADAWGYRGTFGFVENHFFGPYGKALVDDEILNIAWIPYPSGRNRLYNARRNQLRARRAVLWAMGERETPL